MIRFGDSFFEVEDGLCYFLRDEYDGCDVSDVWRMVFRIGTIRR